MSSFWWRGEYKPLFEKYKDTSFTQTFPYTPGQNPISERINKTLNILQAHFWSPRILQGNFWSFTVEHIKRLYNNMPHSDMETTPAERLNGKRKSARTWRLFGSKAFVNFPKQKQRGFGPKGKIGILFSCLPHGIYKVPLTTGKIIEYRHVKVDEACFRTVHLLRYNNICSDSEDEGIDFEWDEDDQYLIIPPMNLRTK